MTEREPVTELGAYSANGVAAVPWSRARDELRSAELYWLSTTRPDGRPHVTPLLGVWHDGALYFCTGPEERKAANLAHNRQCVVTTGRNTFDHALDVVVEGIGATVVGDAERRGVADAYETKYGAHLTDPDGTWFGLGDNLRDGSVLTYRVTPTKVFGFGKGDGFSQTRYRFDGE